MRDMEKIDLYSYRCGVIDCFNEMVHAGLKPLALAHPCDTPQERDRYLSFCDQICAQYGTRYVVEDEPLLSDLFPVSMNRGKYGILFYREDAVLLAYRRIKADKRALLEDGAYAGKARREIALRFGALLAYPPQDCERLIAQNDEKE